MRRHSGRLALCAISFLLAASPRPAEAAISLSLNGGPVRSWMEYEDFWDEIWESQDALTSYTLGVGVQFHLGGAARLESGLRYVRLRNRIYVRGPAETGSFDQTLEYLSVPFALRLYPGAQRVFFFGGGV